MNSLSVIPNLSEIIRQKVTKSDLLELIEVEVREGLEKNVARLGKIASDADEKARKFGKDFIAKLTKKLRVDAQKAAKILGISSPIAHVSVAQVPAGLNIHIQFKSFGQMAGGRTSSIEIRATDYVSKEYQAHRLESKKMYANCIKTHKEYADACQKVTDISKHMKVMSAKLTRRALKGDNHGQLVLSLVGELIGSQPKPKISSPRKATKKTPPVKAKKVAKKKVTKKITKKKR